MSRCRNTTDLDLTTWPEFDTQALAPDQRRIFGARRVAIELYLANTPMERIRK